MEENNKKQVVVIYGPTASGKTKISIELAKEINGEIVSADSMQLYKYMNIGTAKPSKEEMYGIRHYMIDELLPSENFSVAQYKKLALKYIQEIIDKGKIPIVVGGTGLYINSLIYNIDYSEAETDWEYRNELQEEAEKFGIEVLYKRLQEVDKQAADKIHINDTKRIIRALEVFKATNKTLTEHNIKSRENPSQYDYVCFGLHMNREYLYERINLRVDKMIEDGLIEETKTIVEKGYSDKDTSMQAIAYKEIIEYFNGNKSLEEGVDFLKQSSRRYAKRQITWFKRIKETNWIEVGEVSDVKKIVHFIKKSLKID